MPYINKPKKNYNRKREKQDLERKNRQKIYQSKTWEDLRKAHLMEHPLCEVSEIMGLTILAEHVHHLISPFNYKGNEQLHYAYSADNLISVSASAHWELHHGKLKGCYSLESIKERLIELGEYKPL